MPRPQRLYQTLVSLFHLLVWATDVMSKFFSTHLSPFQISARCPRKQNPRGPLRRIETIHSSVYKTNCDVFFSPFFSLRIRPYRERAHSCAVVSILLAAARRSLQ